MAVDREYEWTKRLLGIIKTLDIGLSSTRHEETPKLPRLKRKKEEQDDFFSLSLKRKLKAEGLTVVAGRRTQ